MSAKYTLGDWIAKPMSGPNHGYDWVVMSGNIVIATFNRKDYPEWNEANARLIAAAPKLLDACKCAEADLFGMVSDYLDVDTETSDEPQAKTIRELQAAIAEAEKE